MTRFNAPISEYIWDLKYRFKDGDTPIDETVEDTWSRIANALASVENDPGGNITDGFYDALDDFKYLPAGRIVAGAGTERAVTLFNCFVMGTIPDSMEGIFEMLKEAALTMQQGGGIGYDFSTIRPSTSSVKKLGADASGPLSFMDCWDAMCRTVMSAGSRRGAMMATMRCDHPDIEKFIEAKRDSSKLRMFNVSVLVTDKFMEAVAENREWPLVHVEPPKTTRTLEILDNRGSTAEKGGGLPRYVHRRVKARDLWNQIMRATYDAAEPGVIFIDRINKANNLKHVETIAATNPCGEQPLPPYGACLLGSINLAKLVHMPFQRGAGIDSSELEHYVEQAVRMMDNVVDTSNFPLEAQKKEAIAKRRIGLGVTGLADALAMVGLTYGTPDAADKTEDWLKRIAVFAYRASIKLAMEKGPFPLFNTETYPPEGSFVAKMVEEDEWIAENLHKYGIRNALLTSIAPTGTISMYADNVSSGIEPIFAYGFNRKVLQPDGSHHEELVEDYAVSEYRKYWEANSPNTAAPFDPEKHLPETFVTAQTLTPEDHIRMQAAAQNWVDSSISKTVNLPADIPFEEFKEVYWNAYESGCKGCTTYRPNDITGSILSVEEKPAETQPEAPYGDELPERPSALDGKTYKIKIGDQSAVYLTVNDKNESDGRVRPFEVFLRSSDPSHDEWMVALARTISAVLRRPYDAKFLAQELKQVHSTRTGGWSGGKYVPSLVAAIGERLAEHMGVAQAVESPEALGDPCPKCHGYNLQQANGCPTCMDCGWSNCG